MIESTIARRYARALLLSSIEKNAVPATLEQFASLQAVFNDHPDLADTLENRFVDLQARYRVIEQVSQKMGLSEDLVHFLKLLIKKARLSLLNLMAQTFREMALEHLGQVEAEVVSASVLSADILAQLQKKLSDKTKKSVLLKSRLDPSVIGGAKIYLGNTLYDGTLRAGLEAMKSKLKEIAS